VGANGNGLLAVWYFPSSGSSTLGVWRNGTFLGDFGSVLNVYDVTEDDKLVRHRRHAVATDHLDMRALTGATNAINGS